VWIQECQVALTFAGKVQAQVAVDPQTGELLKRTPTYEGTRTAAWCVLHEDSKECVNAEAKPFAFIQDKQKPVIHRLYAELKKIGIIPVQNEDPPVSIPKKTKANVAICDSHITKACFKTFLEGLTVATCTALVHCAAEDEAEVRAWHPYAQVCDNI
jgi:hypothetical protein